MQEPRSVDYEDAQVNREGEGDLGSHPGLARHGLDDLTMPMPLHGWRRLLRTIVDDAARVKSLIVYYMRSEILARPGGFLEVWRLALQETSSSASAGACSTAA